MQTWEGGRSSFGLSTVRGVRPSHGRRAGVVVQMNAAVPASSGQRPPTSAGLQGGTSASEGSSKRDIQNFMKDYLATNPGAKPSGPSSAGASPSAWAHAGKGRKLGD